MGQIETSAHVRHARPLDSANFTDNNMAKADAEASYRHLTDVQVTKCLALAKGGAKQRAIATEIGCSKSTVGRLVNRYHFETFVGRTPPKGPALKTSKSDDRHLIVTAKRNFDRPLQDITNLSGLPISRYTARRRLKEVDLQSRYAKRKPFLSAKHKQVRLEWALRYKDWTAEDWMKVIWSDEALIRIGHDSRRHRVIRPIGAGLQERYLLPSFKSNQVTIMVWTCFCGDKIGPIITWNQGGIGAVKYMEMLSDGLVPMIDDLLKKPVDQDTIRVADENSLLFMQDNAPCHRDRRVSKFLQDRGIPVMRWPAQSPDLNPLENVWPDLKHRFYKRFIDLGLRPSASSAAVTQYIKIIRESWADVDQEFLHRLIKSMPKRVATVIAANGGATKY